MKRAVSMNASWLRAALVLAYPLGLCVASLCCSSKATWMPWLLAGGSMPIVQVCVVFAVVPGVEFGVDFKFLIRA
jgi:hypothetical protein